jgi:hypothetical protein
LGKEILGGSDVATQQFRGIEHFDDPEVGISLHRTYVFP